MYTDTELILGWGKILYIATEAMYIASSSQNGTPKPSNQIFQSIPSEQDASLTGNIIVNVVKYER